MKNRLRYIAATFFGVIILSASAMAQEKIKGEEVAYKLNGVTMIGYVAYDSTIQGKRPAVVVVHEWWGSGDYVRKRARMLAELGYIAIAADLYGDGKMAGDPATAKEFAMVLYNNPNLAKLRIEAAINKVKEYAQTDPDKIAAIGYCFGGSMVLNAAKMGADLEGVVSFHGGLAGVPATTNSTKGKILVCHGGADKFISEEEIKAFKHNLDSVGVDYTFKVYKNATHAFSNPKATETGIKFNMPIKYNEKADRRSWKEMKKFLKEIFK
ncbi:dienelactone hydrolase family protein [Ferruginibacter sp. SUN002]|uniref:dienelactone hydrolase family protein n=1 Tax=Ferruginibacter sp. SUN002 TaxID=2937789 RepID=UPI003D35B55A